MNSSGPIMISSLMNNKEDALFQTFHILEFKDIPVDPGQLSFKWSCPGPLNEYDDILRGVLVVVARACMPLMNIPLCTLDTAENLLERLLLPRLVEATKAGCGLSYRQHGFGVGRYIVAPVRSIELCHVGLYTGRPAYLLKMLTYTTVDGKRQKEIAVVAVHGLILGSDLWDIAI
ncbi:hypothetical protein J6590_059832 [Homalodisca vitripennis]|nr:hypothetical protein J6590_059832 [Homalodisca vitripennis]